MVCLSPFGYYVGKKRVEISCSHQKAKEKKSFLNFLAKVSIFAVPKRIKLTLKPRDVKGNRRITMAYLSTKVNLPKHVATNDNIRQLVDDEIKRLGWEADLQFIDTSEVTNMRELFANTCFCGDVSKWDVSKVEDMTGMFRNCRASMAI